MSELARRPMSSAERRRRERRAWQVTIAGAAAGVLTISLVLTIVGVVSFAVPALAALVAGGCAYALRRTLSA